MLPADGRTMDITSHDIRFTMLSPADRLQTLRLDRLLREWRAAAPADGLPHVGFADPLQLTYLIGAMLILDVEHVAPDQPARFRYRLIGTEITGRSGRDLTGVYVDAHPERSFAKVAQRVCTLVVEARAPVHGVMLRQLGDQKYPVELLLLPLADPAGSIVRLLAAELYPADAPRRMSFHPQPRP